MSSCTIWFLRRNELLFPSQRKPLCLESMTSFYPSSVTQHKYTWLLIYAFILLQINEMWSQLAFNNFLRYVVLILFRVKTFILIKCIFNRLIYLIKLDNPAFVLSILVDLLLFYSFIYSLRFSFIFFSNIHSLFLSMLLKYSYMYA